LEIKAFAAVCQLAAFPPDRHQDIIPAVGGIAFARSSLRRIIPPYGPFVAPQRPRRERDLRLASNILLVIRSFAKSSGETHDAKIGWWI
jgi:hypothetical protein